jgi:integrase
MDAKTPKPQAQVYKMIALPAREKYEPWTVNLMEWFLDNNKKMGFDLTRQSMYHIVKNVLRRFDFPSYPHALRHFRCTHLVTEYGYNAADVAAITGWKMQTGFNLLSMASPMMDTYLHLTWREYFPKLVKPIDQLLDVTPHVLLEPASDRAPELNLA